MTSKTLRRSLTLLLVAALICLAGAAAGIWSVTRRHPGYVPGAVMARCLARNPTDAEGCGNMRTEFYDALTTRAVLGAALPGLVLGVAYLVWRRPRRATA